MKLAGLILLGMLALRADVVVSPGGSDDNPGTEEEPVLTLERAKALIHLQGGGTVWLRAGVYELKETLALTAEDSNTTWSAWPDEEVRITGGRTVKGWKPAEDRPRVFVADLPGQEITKFGGMSARGFGRPIQAAGLELFYRGEPMPLAGWPNVGWAYTSEAGKGQFKVASERLARWSKEQDLWVHGYWTYDWADSYEHVAAVDAGTGVIKTDAPHGVYGYAAGKRFRVVNALAELDEPGEWYLDRQSGQLYFWPPAELGDGDVTVSLLETPMVTITNAKGVRLAGLIFENTRGSGVEIGGGQDCTVSFCVLRNIGTVAVQIEGGREHWVEGGEISQTGEGGIIVNGGDRKKLVGSGHTIAGNRIWRYSRWVRTYRPAVSIGGVGQQVVENRMDHGPHEAIALTGNNHLIAGNDIHTAVWETADAGAFYMGRDWTYRGNVLTGNYFHNLGEGDVNGVYLDDLASGTLVERNYFQRAGRSVFIGGGRDNIIRSNVFVQANPAIEVDARGLTWGKKWLTGEDPTVMDRLKAMPYKVKPWSEQYPGLAKILTDEPAVPKGNVIEGNSNSGGGWLRLRDGSEKWVEVKENYTGDEAVSLEGAPDLGEVGDVLSYRVVNEQGKVKLVIENLGKTPAWGRVRLWAWPEQVKVAEAVPFELDPGEKAEHALTPDGTDGLKQYWIGAQLKGDDLRPMGTVVKLPEN